MTAAITLLAGPRATWACSLSPCVDGGQKVRSSFEVFVEHEGKGLPGANVTIHAAGKMVIQGSSDQQGKLKVVNLPKGEYWISIEHLGLSAAEHCFQVTKGFRDSKGYLTRGKKRLQYEWGTFPYRVHAIRGKLMDLQSDPSLPPLLRLIRPLRVPIMGTEIQLETPLRGVYRSSHSDARGAFDLENIPNGIYVMRLLGGASYRTFAEEKFLVTVDDQAKDETIEILKQDGRAGECCDPCVSLGVQR